MNQNPFLGIAVNNGSVTSDMVQLNERNLGDLGRELENSELAPVTDLGYVRVIGDVTGLLVDLTSCSTIEEVMQSPVGSNKVNACLEIGGEVAIGPGLTHDDSRNGVYCTNYEAILNNLEDKPKVI